MQKNFHIGKITIDKELLFLLIIGGLYAFGIFLSNTFVNVYLWKQSGEYKTIAIYNLGIYLLQPITFIFAGKIAKKIDRVIVLRLGVIFLSFFFLGVLLTGEKIATYNFMLGSLLGIGYGFYWLAFNVLTFEITEPDTRDFFNGILGVLQSFGGMISPLIAGLIIKEMSGNTGYTVIFTISFIFFICAVLCSLLLKRRQAEGKFMFKKVLLERRHNKNWRRILNAHTFEGLREGMFLFVITIWVYLITNSELSIGVFNMVLSALSFTFYFVVMKLIKPAYRKKSILFGAILLYMAIYVIIVNMNYVSLIVYAIMVGMAHPLIHVPYVSMTYDVIGKARHAKELRVEYIVVRELFINIGRVASICVFLLAVTFFQANKVIPLLLIIFGTGHIFIYFFIKNIFLKPYQNEVMVKDQLIDEKKR